MTADITAWEAWERGVAAALQAMADADHTAKQPDVRADSRWQPDQEPVVYCAEADCFLTCAPGHARCWVHRPADRTREGLLG